MKTIKTFLIFISLSIATTVYAPKENLLEEARNSSYYKYNVGKTYGDLYATARTILLDSTMNWPKKRVVIVALVLAGLHPAARFNSGLDLESLVLNCMIEHQDAPFGRTLFKLHPELANMLFFDRRAGGYRRPLWHASTVEFAQALVEFGGNVITHGDDCYNVPLHRVGYDPDFAAELIPFYVNHGVSPNLRNENDQTPLVSLLAHLWSYKYHTTYGYNQQGKYICRQENKMPLFVRKLKLFHDNGADITLESGSQKPLEIFLGKESSFPLDSEAKNTIVDLLTP